jgi:CarD family transcriptional regulator
LDAEHLYYVLEPVYQGGVLYVPADNPKIFLRPVITADEANRLIDEIPQLRGEAFHSRSAQELSAHYEQALQTHRCEDLVELTKSIYKKKTDLARHNKKFGRVDEHFMRRAEDSLYGELAIALDIPRDHVQEYIANRIGDTAQG